MPTDSDFKLRRREWLLSMLAVLGGCGVDSGGTGTGTAATLAAGPISGFGSIIVNGVRYDDATAVISDDDGRIRSRAELRLGMRTEVLASAVIVSAGVASATASAIHLRREIVGPVQALDAAKSRLTVLGQRVSIGATTVFDTSLPLGLASLATGDILEVYAVYDVAAGQFVATRIDRLASATAYKLRGVIASLSLTAKTLTVGALRVDWLSVAPADPATALAPGQFVQLTLATAPVSGVWRAIELVAGLPALADRERAEIEGRITAFSSSTSFALNGSTVDASTASFPNGSAGLALGAKVEVQGSIRGGVIVASSVAVESEVDQPEPFELHGAILSIDAAAQSFIVQGVTVVWGSATVFESSTAADLRVGRQVEVRGALSTGGTRIDATRIHVEL
jgi:hypothetical protein